MSHFVMTEAQLAKALEIEDVHLVNGVYELTPQGIERADNMVKYNWAALNTVFQIIQEDMHLTEKQNIMFENIWEMAIDQSRAKDEIIERLMGIIQVAGIDLAGEPLDNPDAT